MDKELLRWLASKLRSHRKYGICTQTRNTSSTSMEIGSSRRWRLRSPFRGWEKKASKVCHTRIISRKTHTAMSTGTIQCWRIPQPLTKICCLNFQPQIKGYPIPFWNYGPQEIMIWTIIKQWKTQGNCYQFRMNNWIKATEKSGFPRTRLEEGHPIWCRSINKRTSATTSISTSWTISTEKTWPSSQIKAHRSRRFTIITWWIPSESSAARNSIHFQRTKITAIIHTWAIIFSKDSNKNKNMKNKRKVSAKRKFQNISLKKMKE